MMPLPSAPSRSGIIVSAGTFKETGTGITADSSAR
jgi:hypothetical protein